MPAYPRHGGHHNSHSNHEWKADEPKIVWKECSGSTRVGIVHRQCARADVVGEAAARGMLLVHDPENKARYLVPPSQHAGDTAGLRDYAEKKQSFLCMLYLKGACKARCACNQLHLPQTVVAACREFAAAQQGSYMVTKQKNFVSFLSVYDSEAGQRVTVPYHLTHATAGRVAAVNGADAQLCLFHATRGCRYGVECKSIHTKSSYQQVRRASCCAEHSSGNGVQPPARPFAVMIAAGCGPAVPCWRTRVAMTKGLQRLLEGRAGEGMVCGRHLQEQCSHGDACNNVHICRKLFQDNDAVSASVCFLAQPLDAAAAGGGGGGRGGRSGSLHSSATAPSTPSAVSSAASSAASLSCGDASGSSVAESAGIPTPPVSPANASARPSAAQCVAGAGAAVGCGGGIDAAAAAAPAALDDDDCEIPQLLEDMVDAITDEE